MGAGDDGYAWSGCVLAHHQGDGGGDGKDSVIQEEGRQAEEGTDEVMLPYPISTNVYWRNFRGRMVRSSAAIAYKDEVGWMAKASKLQLFTVPVMVMLVLHPVRPADAEKREKKDRLWGLGVRRIDIDNAQKVALDALQGIAYENDRQITFLSIRLGQPVKDGGLHVTITEDKDWA